MLFSQSGRVPDLAGELKATYLLSQITPAKNETKNNAMPTNRSIARRLRALLIGKSTLWRSKTCGKRKFTKSGLI